MLTNEEMKAGRFLRWHTARSRFKEIQAHFARGGRVQMTTYTKSTVFAPKHADMFKATRSGLYVQRGRHWDCADGVHLRLL